MTALNDSPMDHPSQLSASDRHGGRLLEARRQFPSAPEPFIDLSTGINPLPYPVPPIEPAAWTRLPEPEEIAALENVAARAYGMPDASMVAALPGTQVLISLLPRLVSANLCRDPQPHLWRIFAGLCRGWKPGRGSKHTRGARVCALRRHLQSQQSRWTAFRRGHTAQPAPRQESERIVNGR